MIDWPVELEITLSLFQTANSVCFCVSEFGLVCSNESSVRDNMNKDVEGRGTAHLSDPVMLS